MGYFRINLFVFFFFINGQEPFSLYEKTQPGVQTSLYQPNVRKVYETPSPAVDNLGKSNTTPQIKQDDLLKSLLYANTFNKQSRASQVVQAHGQVHGQGNDQSRTRIALSQALPMIQQSEVSPGPVPGSLTVNYASPNTMQNGQPYQQGQQQQTIPLNPTQMMNILRYLTSKEYLVSLANKPIGPITISIGPFSFGPLFNRTIGYFDQVYSRIPPFEEMANKTFQMYKNIFSAFIPGNIITQLNQAQPTNTIQMPRAYPLTKQ